MRSSLDASLFSLMAAAFVFIPKHGPWLNLIEGFFSEMDRCVPRGIRVASKAELKERILAYLEELNRDPIIHTCLYKPTQPL